MNKEIVPQINLTDLEIIGLQSITYSDFYENGRESIVWDFSVYDDCPLKGKVRSGVYSSLSQKGIVEISLPEKKYNINEKGEKILNRYYERGNNYGTLKITPLGYELLDSLNLIDADGRFL